MWRVSNPPLLLCRTSINNDYVCFVLCGNIFLYSKLKRMAEQLVELKGVIFDIQENYEKSYTPKSGVNANVELFKHKVILLSDKKEGVFFQTTKELMFNKEKCFIGQEICYTQRPSTVEGKPTVFTMCNERDVQTQQSGSTSKDDISKVTGTSFSYAKDVVNACYEGQGKTLDEYVKAIKETATDFKKFLLENN